MNNTKLSERRASLDSTFNEIVKKLQELEAAKNELIANANAVKGAIALVDEFLAQSDEKVCETPSECKVVPISQ